MGHRLGNQSTHFCNWNSLYTCLLSSKKLVFRLKVLMLLCDQLQRRKVSLEYLLGFLTMHCERLITTSTHPPSFWRRVKLHEVTDPISISIPGRGSYPVCYADEIVRTSSCKRSRFLIQQASLKIITQKRRSQLPVHLDLPILRVIPRDSM
ncbi:hypothetical protein BDR07DRAFT_1422021 [Suillus spraguei]|nr:hypothetical protein BDR07DRAFT_1422021 [Suillus spraguei]